MPWTVARGVYKKGVIEPLDVVPRRDGMEVLVLFPEPIEGAAESKGIWQRIKRELARKIPELARMTADEKREEFDRLSRVVAKQMPYRSVEEFERAMRREEHGLVGY
jgi:predicted DNA-binding antitoxin AbrB/MazE fold protein